MKSFHGKESILLFALLIPLLLFNACASIGLTGFSAGEPKNSMPVVDKDLLEEVYSISVPAFYGDKHNWRKAAVFVLSLSRASVVPFEKVDTAVRSIKKDMSVLSPSERIESLTKIGRTLQSEAVLNGIILTKDRDSEIILQLISSRDSRILWWQAVDFSFKGETLSLNDQRALLSKMLDPVFLFVGKKARPTTPARTQDTDKKPGREIEPSSESDISPM